MEGLNRPGMDLITPGGVGLSELLQTEGGITTFLGLLTRTVKSGKPAGSASFWRQDPKVN